MQYLLVINFFIFFMPESEKKSVILAITGYKNIQTITSQMKKDNGAKYFGLYYIYHLYNLHIASLEEQIEKMAKYIANYTSDDKRDLGRSKKKHERLNKELIDCYALIEKYENNESIKISDIKWFNKGHDLLNQYDLSHIKGDINRPNRHQFGNVGTVLTLGTITRELHGGMMLVNSKKSQETSSHGKKFQEHVAKLTLDNPESSVLRKVDTDLYIV